MSKMNEAYVQIKRENNISTIEFSHPAHNSLPGSLLRSLTDAIIDEGRTPDTSVILLKSSGNRTFCAGASFDELLSIDNFEQGKEFFMGFARVINSCRKCPKIIVGRVQGKAIGGGVGLASAVDYCFATNYSSVKLSELALGIGPFVVGPAVQRKIGTAAFSEMSINAGAFKTAQWAWTKGLFTEVFKDNVEMDSHIKQFLTVLCEYSTLAMKKMKSILWENCEHWDDLLEARAEISGSLILSKEAKKIISEIKRK